MSKSFRKRAYAKSKGLKLKKISNNVDYSYSGNVRDPFLYKLDAVYMGWRVIGQGYYDEIHTWINNNNQDTKNLVHGIDLFSQQLDFYLRYDGKL